MTTETIERIGARLHQIRYVPDGEQSFYWVCLLADDNSCPTVEVWPDQLETWKKLKREIRRQGLDAENADYDNSEDTFKQDKTLAFSRY